MLLFVRQKVQISSKILPQIPNFASFPLFENVALLAVHNSTVTAVGPILFYKVLPKQFEAFGFYISQEKKTGITGQDDGGGPTRLRLACEFNSVQLCRSVHA